MRVAEQRATTTIPGQISLDAMPWLNEEDKVEKVETPKTAERLTIYELPLNERMRVLLRLENLFEEAAHHMAGDHIWDSRAAIKVLMSILNVFHNRPDTKTELIKEMDRISATLSKFANIEGVNLGRLDEVRQELSSLALKLKSQPGKLGENLRKNELIASLKQRENIIGGALPFDLPNYGHWLSRDPELRRQDLNHWLSEFSLVKQSVTALLRVTRDSAVPTLEQAKDGFFQTTLESSGSYQMIRVIMPAQKGICAEVSGGRHRFTVHFLKIDCSSTRPTPIRQDVKFQLACCAL